MTTTTHRDLSPIGIGAVMVIASAASFAGGQSFVEDFDGPPTSMELFFNSTFDATPINGSFDDTGNTLGITLTGPEAASAAVLFPNPGDFVVSATVTIEPSSGGNVDFTAGELSVFARSDFGPDSQRGIELRVQNVAFDSSSYEVRIVVPSGVLASSPTFDLTGPGFNNAGTFSLELRGLTLPSGSLLLTGTFTPDPGTAAGPAGPIVLNATYDPAGLPSGQDQYGIRQYIFGNNQISARWDDVEVSVSEPTSPAPPDDPGPFGWRPIFLVSQDLLDDGVTGGEGGQWPLAIEYAPSDPNFLMYGTDVGGIYRSLDGGQNWKPMNLGYTPRGACDFAIDPVNPDRVLAVGANSTNVGGDVHGVWYSLDRGSTWQQAGSAPGQNKPQNNEGHRDTRDQLVFDPASSNPSAGVTSVVYWAYDGSGDEPAALYKSSDGGLTWSLLSATVGISGMNDAIVDVHPTLGYVYIATSSGIYRSTNGGTSFAQSSTAAARGLDVSPATPNSVWAVTSAGLLVSANSGQTFTSVSSTGFPANQGQPNRIEVSPADSSRMVIDARYGNFQYQRFFSTNGGTSWTQSIIDSTRAFLPFNQRPHDLTWHPTDPNTLFSFGGDWITRSTDAGQTFEMFNEGNNGFLIGENFTFNVNDPDLLYIGSQDYGSALTTDGGDTWEYVDLTGQGFGGFVYGAYAASPTFLFGGRSANGPAGNRVLRTKAGPSAPTIDTGIVLDGPDICNGDPFNSNILFAHNYRSSNSGVSWAPMVGCDGVFWVSSATPGLMYGLLEPSTVVRSTDSGVTWSPFATLPDPISDIAYADGGDAVWAATDSRRLFVMPIAGGVFERTALLPADQLGNKGAKTVAIDPVDPTIIYAGVSRDIYKTNASLMRSIDSGITWSIIHPTDNPAGSAVPFGGEGPTETAVVRVHPGTREIWVSTSTYGNWRAFIPRCPLDVEAPLNGTPDAFDLAAVITSVSAGVVPTDAALSQYLLGGSVQGCP
ncbi:MAG: hypothetical protein AAGI30_12680 [Planctomycetota bacterium]